MLMLLADAVTTSPLEPLKTLVEQWPWLAVVMAIAKWLANILDRVATRHVVFIDALDKRDQEQLVHQATMSLALTSIVGELAAKASKSDIQELASKSHCEAAALLRDHNVTDPSEHVEPQHKLWAPKRR